MLSASSSSIGMLPRMRISRTSVAESSTGSILDRDERVAESSDADTNSTTTPRPSGRMPSPTHTPDATVSRLKDLLGRKPQLTPADISTATSFASPAKHKGALSSPSEHDSDFESITSGTGQGHTSLFGVTTPRAHHSDHRASLKELFLSASRPTEHSPPRSRRSSTPDHTPSHRPPTATPPMSDSEDIDLGSRHRAQPRDKSSSISLNFSKSASFDLLRDSMPGMDSRGTGISASSESLVPDHVSNPRLPPSPDSPTSRPSVSLSQETPRPVLSRRPSSPIRDSSLASLAKRGSSPAPIAGPSSAPLSSITPLMESYRSFKLSNRSSPSFDKSDRDSTSSAILPPELTTPPARPRRDVGSTAAAKLKEQQERQEDERRQQQLERLRQQTSTPPPAQRQPTLTPPPAQQLLEPGTATKTPRVPGFFPLTPQPRVSHGHGHKRSPSFSPNDFGAADIPFNASSPRSSPNPTFSRPAWTAMTPGPQTPAIPGGWQKTPLVLKSALKKKVHWHDQKQEESESGLPDDSTGQLSVNGTPTPPQRVGIPQGSTPRTTPSAPRLLDKFGRERQFAEDGTEILLDEPKPRRSSPTKNTKPPPLKAPTPIKIEPRPQADAPLTPPIVETKTRKALPPSWDELRRGLSTLREELDTETKRANATNTQLSTPSDSSTETPSKIEALAERQRRARANRGQLKAGVDSASSWFSKLRRPFSVGLALWMLPIFLFLLWFVFRLAQSRALYIYSTSFSDPLYPSVYQAVSARGWLANPLPDAWGAFSPPAATSWSFEGARTTWLGFLLQQAELWLLGDSAGMPAPGWTPT